MSLLRRSRGAQGSGGSSTGDSTPGKRALTDRFARRPRADDGVVRGAESAVSAATGDSGQPLPAALQQKFGAALSTDVSDVRVHTGAPSAAAADAVGALAYATGHDIHFAAGQYAPGAAGGEHLLAHEVAHTVQQGGVASAPQAKLEVSVPGDSAEVEADRAADAMVAGAPATVTPASAAIARQVVPQTPAPAGGDHAVQGPTGAATEGSAAATTVATPRRARPASGDSSPPIDAPPGPPTRFLGHWVRGAHPVLLEALARAQSHLESTVTVPAGSTLGQELRIHQEYSVRRNHAEYHTFGLAIDINYLTNPYVGGDRAASTQVNDQSLQVIRRAVWLTGQGEALSPRDSHQRSESGAGAEALYDHFAGADHALEEYLGADRNTVQVTAWIDAHNLAGGEPPPDVPRQLCTPGVTAAQWLRQIHADRALLRGSGGSNWRQGSSQTGPMRPLHDRTRANGVTTHGELGFMDLDRRLVIALRDHAGLAWGASDFGNGGANGDFMHFDCRHFHGYTEGTLATAIRRAAAEQPAALSTARHASLASHSDGGDESAG